MKVLVCRRCLWPSNPSRKILSQEPISRLQASATVSLTSSASLSEPLFIFFIVFSGPMHFSNKEVICAGIAIAPARVNNPSRLRIIWKVPSKVPSALMLVMAKRFLKRSLRASIVTVAASCLSHFMPILNMADMSLQKALNDSVDKSNIWDSTAVPDSLESVILLVLSWLSAFSSVSCLASASGLSFSSTASVLVSGSAFSSSVVSGLTSAFSSASCLGTASSAGASVAAGSFGSAFSLLLSWTVPDSTDSGLLSVASSVWVVAIYLA